MLQNSSGVADRNSYGHIAIFKHLKNVFYMVSETMQGRIHQLRLENLSQERICVRLPLNSNFQLASI